MVQADRFESESERVTRELRDEILDGLRSPGSRLVERDVAEELGVSRVPVRDALRALVTEGLVTARPRSWAIVREFTASDIADLNEVREVFEPLTFRLAAERRTRAGLQQLHAVVDAEFRFAQNGDAVRARRSAADFHEVVTALAANELLAELERPLRSRLRWLMSQHEDLLAVAEQHQALYAAIAERDLERVDRLAVEHLRAGQARAAAHGAEPAR